VSGLLADLRAGLRLFSAGLRCALGLLPLWLWLYAAVALLGAAAALPSALFVGWATLREPALSGGGAPPWFELFVTGRAVAAPLLGGLGALFFGLLLGPLLSAGVAGAVAARRDGREVRPAFGAAAAGIFGASFVYSAAEGAALALALLGGGAALFASGSPALAGGLSALLLTLFALASLAADLARSVRVRGEARLFGAAKRALSEIRRAPCRALSLALPLTALSLAGGLLALWLLAIGLSSPWAFLLQQAAALLLVGQKVAAQAAADSWARP
jgi:hypothetical protein